MLALDGGGVRGTLILGFLEAMERLLRERHQRPDLRLCDYFDLIGGTSAGALLAAALATGMDTRTLTEKAMDAIGRIFGKRKWTFWTALFDPEPLQTVLTEVFDDLVLGDERLETGLCIITKRADTRSIWPLINHPNGRFYRQNREILLRNAVYASAAAPFYFIPTRFDVGQGEYGAFVDGGVSMANNPALQLFYIATLKGFPFHWPTGENSLLLVSVGTGCWQQRDASEKVVRSRAWDWTVEVPTMLMEDANAQVQMLLQYLSRTPTPWNIDAETGDLEDDLLLSEPALSYLRYNVRLEQGWLRDHGIEVSEQGSVSLRGMSDRDNREMLLQLSRAAAARQVEPGHFASVFDLSGSDPA